MSARPQPGPLPGDPGDEGTDAVRLPAPALRGATLIPETVVARITARAAHEALSGQPGLPGARPALGAPRSTATVHHGSARIGVALDLPYPIDIARTCGEIRHYVTERVSHLTGMHIDDLTVSVHRLVPDESQRQGRVH